MHNFFKNLSLYHVLCPILIGKDLKRKKKVKTNALEQEAKKKDKEAVRRQGRPGTTL